jgi:hypothetical protein
MTIINTASKVNNATSEDGHLDIGQGGDGGHRTHLIRSGVPRDAKSAAETVTSATSLWSSSTRRDLEDRSNAGLSN